MGYGSYCTIADIKGILGITATTDDTVIRKIAESASRYIDNYCNRHFYTISETRYFDGAKTLWVPDLLSVTTLKTDEDGDGTFENTLATTDYILYGAGGDDALNLYPRVRIEISEDSDYGSFANGIKKGVEIAGAWGYGDGTTATPYVTTSITGTVDTTTGLTLTLSADGTIEVGHTILCESEQMYVTALGTLSATVERGVNGSTAAIHSAKTLYYYRYPRDIYQACIDLSVALYQNRGKKGIQSERLGDYTYTMSREMMNGILEDSIPGYKRRRF